MDLGKGRKRLFQVVVQGQFKKEINANDIIFGSEYSQPLNYKPPAILMKPVHALIRRSNPGIEIDLLSDKPKVLCNFSGGIQAIRMDKPGLEPDITSFNIEENNEGFGGTFTKKKRTSDKRKKIFNNPKTASEYTFDTTSVYTFDHYDDVMELSTCCYEWFFFSTRSCSYTDCCSTFRTK